MRPFRADGGVDASGDVADDGDSAGMQIFPKGTIVEVPPPPARGWRLHTTL